MLVYRSTRRPHSSSCSTGPETHCANVCEGCRYQPRSS
jgi:hypothetical protein